jgi:UDP-GlcNAc:undecaprenyl-phosphate/decaprenyl-phosphate GlcNAc-1-phosphate transferase
MLDFNLYILLIVYFIALLFGSYFIHKFLLIKSTTYNIRKANQNAIRWGKQTKPVSGGITFFLTLLLSFIVYMIYKKDIQSIAPEYIYLGVVLLLSFLMGLADDMISTSPYLKFFIQIICALILIKADIYIHISAEYYINVIFTTLWIIGIMNSINMLDNMDAISTLITISVVIGFIIQNILISGDIIDLFIFIAMLASLLSFLKFNWNPSKMYMGDNGSQLLGAFMGTYSIIYFWNSNVPVNIHPTFFHILIVFLIFLIPITDTTTVTINRLLKKKSPFVGGRDHTTHFFSYRGFSESQIAILYLIINCLSVLFAIFILNTTGMIPFWIGVFSLIYGIFVFSIFYLFTRITKPVEIEKN